MAVLGLGDVNIINGNWLETGKDIPGGIIGDDGIVNFPDFADFALV
jgi:hypothetical protein